MHAKLHISALVPYLAPRMTSGERYCLVWMSCVNCRSTQHAFPKSQILASRFFSTLYGRRSTQSTSSSSSLTPLSSFSTDA